MTDLGNFIRTRRSALALTQTELARRVGVEDAYISAIERGVRTPGVGFFLDQLGQALALDSIGQRELEEVAESSRRSMRFPNPMPLFKYRVISALVKDQALTEAEMGTIADAHAAILQTRNIKAGDPGSGGAM